MGRDLRTRFARVCSSRLVGTEQQQQLSSGSARQAMEGRTHRRHASPMPMDRPSSSRRSGSPAPAAATGRPATARATSTASSPASRAALSASAASPTMRRSPTMRARAATAAAPLTPTRTPTRLTRRPDSPGRKPPLSTVKSDAATHAASTATAPTAEDPARSAVTVAVRIRPTSGAKTIVRHGRREEAALQVSGARGGADEPKVFSFDHIFDQANSQADVYEALGPPVLQMLQCGHNASVFAYGQVSPHPTPGMCTACASHAHCMRIACALQEYFAYAQTGSGKTYTMLGTDEVRCDPGAFSAPPLHATRVVAAAVSAAAPAAALHSLQPPCTRCSRPALAAGARPRAAAV